MAPALLSLGVVARMLGGVVMREGDDLHDVSSEHALHSGSSGWWHRFPVFVLAILLAGVPLLWPRIPPLLDLPSHMAGYHVSIHLADTAVLRQYFGFQWHLIGNLGVDLLMVPLGKLIGTEIAVKLIVLTIPMLTAAGLLLVSRAALNRVQPTALLAIPLAYNYSFMLGFVNYGLAAALALLTFALWLTWPSNRRPAVRAVSFAAAAAAIWLSHAIGWVLLGAMAGAAELHWRLAARQPIARAAVGTVVTCLPLAAPLLLMPLSPHSSGMSATGFFQFDQAAKWIAMSLRDRWFVLDFLSILTVIGVIGAALLRLGGLRIAPRLGWPAVALVVLCITAPQDINGSTYVAARNWPYAAMLALLAIDCSRLKPSRQRLLAVTCMSFLVVRIAANTASFIQYDRSYTRELEALYHAPHGSAVVALIGIPCPNRIGNWADPRLYHLPGMAVVRNAAFVNTTWSVGGLHLLENRYMAAGAFASDPSEMVSTSDCAKRPAPPIGEALARLPYEAFDRLWLINVPRTSWPSSSRLRKVWQAEASVMYAIEHER